jgi:anti-anti-sigma factor
MADLPAADAIVLLEVSGELDMASAEALRIVVRREIERGSSAAIIDLSGCPFFDSTGMSVMLELNGELGAKDIPLLLVIPPEPAPRRRLVAIAGLELALLIFDSAEEALAGLTVEGVPEPAVRRREVRL